MFKIITKTVNTTLPLYFIKGSTKQRNQMASNMSKKLYNEVKQHSNSTSCTIENFTNSLNKILNNKINFNIFPNDDPITSAKIKFNITGHKIDFSNNRFNIFVDGYNMYLPLDTEQKIIKNKYTAFHEVRHMFDHIFNPKTCIYRLNNMDGVNGEYLETKRAEIFDMFVYNLDQPVYMQKKKKTIIQKMNELPDRISIDILQDIRNHLKSEINAYNDEIKFMTKGLGIIKNFSEIKTNKLFLNKFAKFKSKLKFANNLLGEKIKTCRLKHKKSLNSGV